jgi:hypothetical protein
MAGETIKEYLVSLGFQVDESGLKKFLGGISDTTKVVTELGAGVVAAAVATVAFVGKMADSVTDLYWASQRLRSGVADIKGFSLGVQQMGGDAAQAQASLENLAAFMRNNPGGERYIHMMLGVDTRDANKNLRSTTDIMNDIGKRLRGLPFWRQKVVANFLGIDDMTLMAMDRGLGKVTDRYKQLFKLAGVNPDKAAEGLKNFHNQLGRLQSTLYVIAVIAAEKLEPVVSWLADKLDWLLGQFVKLQNSKLGKSLHDTADAFMHLLHKLKDVEGWMVDHLNVFQNAETIFRGIADAITVIIDLLSGRWKDAWKKAADIGGDIHDLHQNAIKTIAKSAGVKVTFGPAKDDVWDWRHWFDFSDGKSGTPTLPSTSEGHPEQPERTSHHGKLPLGMRENNPGNLRPGGHEAEYGSLPEGIAAAYENLLAYQRKHGLNTIREIISRWAPPKENNTAAYIADVSKRLGVGADESVDVSDVSTAIQMLMAIFAHENSGMTPDQGMVQRAVVGRQWIESWRDAYQRAARSLAARHRELQGGLGNLHENLHAIMSNGQMVMDTHANQAPLGVSHITHVTQHNSIKSDVHVDGAKDPHAVAKHVVSQQDRAFGTLLRNVRTAFA